MRPLIFLLLIFVFYFVCAFLLLLFIFHRLFLFFLLSTIRLLILFWPRRIIKAFITLFFFFRIFLCYFSYMFRLTTNHFESKTNKTTKKNQRLQKYIKYSYHFHQNKYICYFYLCILFLEVFGFLTLVNLFRNDCVVCVGNSCESTPELTREETRKSTQKRSVLLASAIAFFSYHS